MSVERKHHPTAKNIFQIIHFYVHKSEYQNISTRGSVHVLEPQHQRYHNYHNHQHLYHLVRKPTACMLVGPFQMHHRLLRVLVSLLDVHVDPVDQAALLNHQRVQLLVNTRQLVYRLHQLLDTLVTGVHLLLHHLILHKVLH